MIDVYIPGVLWGLYLAGLITSEFFSRYLGAEPGWENFHVEKS